MQPPANERTSHPLPIDIVVPALPREGDTFRDANGTLYDIGIIEFRQSGATCELVAYLVDIVPESEIDETLED